MIDLRSLFLGSILMLSGSAAFAQETPPTPEPSEAPAATSTPDVVAPTVSASLTLTLDASSDIERRTTVYQCNNGEGFRVSYVNAAPNFLAILPVEGQTYIFVTAVSGSGARYVSGPYEWWDNGDEATLRDLRAAEDEAPIATCLAASPTP
ncbi:MliC family protein [Devosia soli]|uniref:MliC family protein n=1 Tax=Devosia soli TaxID=361041 RepID=UPI00069AD9B7|nr:MliC family protein [Devosia soli]